MKNYTTDQVVEAYYNYQKYADHNIDFEDWLRNEELKQIVAPQWIKEHNNSFGNHIDGPQPTPYN